MYDHDMREICACTEVDTEVYPELHTKTLLYRTGGFNDKAVTNRISVISDVIK